MTIVVGYPIQSRAKSVIDLCALVARSSGHEDVVVCTVVPAASTHGIRSNDPGYRLFTGQLAHDALDSAKQDMPTDINARYMAVSAHSPARGLLDVASRVNASAIVVGSVMGTVERITLSSIANRLLHGSPYPVVLPTNDFHADAGTVTRITVAFGGDQNCHRTLTAAHALSVRYGAALRIAAFGVYGALPTGGRRGHVDTILDTWEAGVRKTAAEVIEARLGGRPDVEVVVGRGEHWDDALGGIEWAAGDVLAIGSSSNAGMVSRVFMGSRASKIIRRSPVPVVCLPDTTPTDPPRQNS